MLKNPKLEAFARELAAHEPMFGSREQALLDAMKVAGYVPSLPNGRKYRNRRDVAERIVELRRAHADFVCADIGRLVHELACIADARMPQYIEQYDDGRTRFKDLATLPHHLQSAVREVKIDKDGNIVQLKLHDKLAAIAALQSYREIAPEKPDKGKRMSADNALPDEPAYDAANDWGSLVNAPAILHS